MKISTILLFQLVLSIEILCEQMIKTANQGQYFDSHINIALGTPAANLSILVTFGAGNEYRIGQFIFDQAIANTDYAQTILSRVNITTFYNMQTSSTAQIQGDYTSPLEISSYGGQVTGYVIEDKMQVGSLNFVYEFNCANNEDELMMPYYNGYISFSRMTDNFIDQMYYKNTISSRDYILQGSSMSRLVDQGGGNYTSQTIYYYNILFDLNSNPLYYKYPSNNAINGISTFDVKVYGLYVNGKDITDLTKYRVITFDNLSNSFGNFNEVLVPPDVYQLMYNTASSMFDAYYIDECVNCLCEEVNLLPTLKIITSDYALYLTPNMYVAYSAQYPICSIQLKSSYNNMFDFSTILFFKNNISIMYQKEIDSIKLIGAQAINHMDINPVIITLSILNSFIFVTLIGVFYSFICRYKLVKNEYYYKTNPKYQTQ